MHSSELTRYFYPMKPDRSLEPGTLAWRVQKRLSATGKTAKGASREADQSESFVKNILSGQSKSPRTAGMQALARVLGTTVDWLTREEGPEELPDTQVEGYLVEPNAEFEHGPTVLPPRTGQFNVPEMGATMGGDGDDDGAFEMNGQIVDYVRRPFGIVNRKDVFSLRVVNDSMAPRFEDGDRIYCEKRKPILRDYVVVELLPKADGRPGKSFIKRLVAQDSATVTVEQFNPRGILEFRRGEIKDLFRVIPERELRGEG